jgi:hypothetical protein
MKNCTPALRNKVLLWICAHIKGGWADQTVGDFMNAKCSQQFANLSAGTYVFVYMQKGRKPTD